MGSWVMQSSDTITRIFRADVNLTIQGIYHSGQWIKYIIVHSLIWILAHRYRLSHTNVLWQLLRSPLVSLYPIYWFNAQWDSQWLDDLKSSPVIDEIFFQRCSYPTAAAGRQITNYYYRSTIFRLWREARPTSPHGTIRTFLPSTRTKSKQMFTCLYSTYYRNTSFVVRKKLISATVNTWRLFEFTWLYYSAFIFCQWFKCSSLSPRSRKSWWCYDIFRSVFPESKISTTLSNLSDIWLYAKWSSSVFLGPQRLCSGTINGAKHFSINFSTGSSKSKQCTSSMEIWLHHYVQFGLFQWCLSTRD